MWTWAMAGCQKAGKSLIANPIPLVPCPDSTHKKCLVGAALPLGPLTGVAERSSFSP